MYSGPVRAEFTHRRALCELGEGLMVDGLFEKRISVVIKYICIYQLLSFLVIISDL